MNYILSPVSFCKHKPRYAEVRNRVRIWDGLPENKNRSISQLWESNVTEVFRRRKLKQRNMKETFPLFQFLPLRSFVYASIIDLCFDFYFHEDCEWFPSWHKSPKVLFCLCFSLFHSFHVKKDRTMFVSTWANWVINCKWKTLYFSHRHTKAINLLVRLGSRILDSSYILLWRELNFLLSKRVAWSDRRVSTRTMSR